MDEEDPKPLTIFGKDVSRIPCFRSSWLYGLSGGTGVGLLYFLFTSKPRMASHVGVGSTLIIVMSYWTFCRYELSRQADELKKMQEYVEKRVLLEGTEMEKLYDADIANVSNIRAESV